MSLTLPRPIAATALGASLLLVGGLIGHSLAPADTATDAAAAPVIAVTADGGERALTTAEAAAFAEHSEPLDPDEARYASNESLDEAEVADRSEEIGESYEIGQPVSLEDLEFLRIYAFSTESATPSAPAVPEGGEAVVASAALPAISQSSSFNESLTKFGTSVNAKGSWRLRISEPDLVTNSWSASWTAKRTAGLAVSKISSTVKVHAYGAVAAYPFVGLIYQKSVSGSTTSSSSYSFSRSASFTGAVTYMTIACSSTFWNARGSFQLSR